MISKLYLMFLYVVELYLRDGIMGLLHSVPLYHHIMFHGCIQPIAFFLYVITRAY